MDKRFFLTVALCFLIFVGYQALFITPPPEQVTPPANTGQQGPPGQPPVGQPPAVGDPAGAGQPAVQPESVGQPAGVGEPAARPGSTGSQPVISAAPTAIPEPSFPVESTQLRNDLVEVTINSQGAIATEIRLTEYRNKDLEEPLDLISEKRLSGKTFALDINGGAPLPWNPNSVPWERVSAADSSDPSYRLTLPDGRTVTKTFHLRPDEYMLEVSLDFAGAWEQYVSFKLYGPERIRHDESSRGFVNQCVYGVADVNGRFAQEERHPLTDPPTTIPRVAWGGLESNYFAFVLRPAEAPKDQLPNEMVMYQTSYDTEWAKESIEQGIQGPPMMVGFRGKLAPGQRFTFEAFCGPKHREVLAKYEANGYGELIDYGSILGFLVHLFLLLMGFFHSMIGSWGIAIILLTVVVKVCLHPINKKNQGVMMRQQKKMAKIQPQMAALKEQHKNDALKANKEIQKLLKEHDVNPAQMFGGCLLMLLQLPIWIALIGTFSVAIELRQEPFLYIADLTLPDRLFDLPGGGIWMFESFNLLPFLYVILTVLSQRMMPRSADPQMQQQQKMMTFMMVAFGFIFYNFSSGLLLYFMTSAALGIVEQKIIRAELKAEGL